MKAVILDGSRKGETSLARVREILDDELAGLGWQVQPFILHESQVAYCLGCFECWTRTPGMCRIDDPAREMTAAIIRSDLVVYLTPITFGGYSSELKKVLDRSIGLVCPFFTRVQGEIHHQPRYHRYPRLLGVGGLPHADPESEQLFKGLVARNALNMHAPAYAAGAILVTAGADTIRTSVQSLLHA